jgi:Mg-chelatase subunit ChlD
MSEQSLIIAGSLRAVARASKVSLAEAFIGCDALVIVDISGSMHTRDARGNRSRYEVACEELTTLQKNLPGRVGIISFNDKTEFCPGGLPETPGESTDMAQALTFARKADAIRGMGFFLISDGLPDDEKAALAQAAKFQNKINVIYVGPEGLAMGMEFLTKLSQATGGQRIDRPLAQQLAATVQRMMLEART